MHRDVKPVYVVRLAQDDKCVVAREENRSAQLYAGLAIEHITRSRKLNARIVHTGGVPSKLLPSSEANSSGLVID